LTRVNAMCLNVPPAGAKPEMGEMFVVSLTKETDTQLATFANMQRVVGEMKLLEQLIMLMTSKMPGRKWSRMDLSQLIFSGLVKGKYHTQ
jgi:hypothetical protein